MEPFVAEMVTIRLHTTRNPQDCRRRGVHWKQRLAEGHTATMWTGVSPAIAEMTMEQQPILTQVAACTMAAAHRRRDHQHSLGADDCHPHVVEVVHLGSTAATVCHDCRLDSGFLPHREAELLAIGHREQTREASVKLRCA
jgi:hypothetical protein